MTEWTIHHKILSLEVEEHQTEVLMTQLLPCLFPRCPQAGTRWQLKLHLSHPAMETSRVKTGNPWVPLLIFHWAELGPMPSPTPITGKGNKITTMDNTSHNLFLAWNGAIFPWVMQGRGKFLDKSGVLLGRKKERRNRMDAGQTASSAHHRELVVEGGGHQRQTIYSTVPLESFPYAF